MDESIPSEYSYKRGANCSYIAKMLIIVTAVVIASSFVLSSAQDQPSAQCIAAYNATFGASTTDTTCVIAYGSMIFGVATDEQRMMVCDAGQQCNTMIENIISICGDTVS